MKEKVIWAVVFACLIMFGLRVFLPETPLLLLVGLFVLIGIIGFILSSVVFKKYRSD